MDCVGVVPDLIIELEEVASEYFLLLVADPPFYRVVSGEQVVFESTENHYKKLIFLFGNEQQELLCEVMVFAHAFECIFAAVDCVWIETSA